jgi:hypothetical protein
MGNEAQNLLVVGTPATHAVAPDVAIDPHLREIVRVVAPAIERVLAKIKKTPCSSRESSV